MKIYDLFCNKVIFDEIDEFLEELDVDFIPKEE